MDIALLLFLILLNGVFAMSEIAVISSRKARLQRLAEDGSPGAHSALALHNEPSNFLSTIQVGITSVGILSGAIGETVLADPLAAWLALRGLHSLPARMDWHQRNAMAVALVIMLMASETAPVTSSDTGTFTLRSRWASCATDIMISITESLS